MPAAPGPVPGQLRIVVIRAVNLRVDEAGDKPDSMVKMRVLKNVKSAEPPPQWESTPVPATCDPEYDQECVLDVVDAAASQLEVTIWNSRDENPQSSFWGECILNLSKLIPYAGNIIEQDFDVKQGKQFKTNVPACGKLMLQIMFQTQEQLESSAMEEQETQNSSILSAGTVNTTGTGTAPQPSPFAMNVTIIEARDLPNTASGEPPETFGCVSIIEDPSAVEDRHFHMLNHDLSGGKEQSYLMQVAPLHWSKPGPRSNSPVWNEGVTLMESHPNVRQMEQLHQEGKLATSQLRAPLEGKPVVFVITLHNRDAYNAGTNNFVGRVVLPEIESAKPVDQWFMLQTQDGTQIEGPSGRPSGLHLQIVYAKASSTPSIGPPNTVPHPIQPVPVPVPAKSPQIPSPRPPPAPPPALAGDAASASVTSAASEEQACTRFAFHIEIVEARHLSTSSGQAATNPFVCVSLVVEPELMQEGDFYLLDHRVGDDVDTAQMYCLPPSCQGKPAPSSGADPMWKESYTVYAAHPSIRRIADLHAADQLQTQPEQVELQGQPVLLLATLHEETPGGPAFCGRFLIPQVHRGQPVDQWFKLHDRDGSPIVGQGSGQPSSVRLRFAYGAVRPSPPPSGSATASEGQGTDKLPAGWEKKMDPSGRMFYVNHTHRTFSWTPPPAASGLADSDLAPPQAPSQPSPRLPPTIHAQAPSPGRSKVDDPQDPPPPMEARSPQLSSSPNIAAPPPAPAQQPSPRAATLSPSHAAAPSPTAQQQQQQQQPSPLRAPSQPADPIARRASADSESRTSPPATRPAPKNTGYAIPGPLYPPKPSLHQAKVFATVVEGAGMPQTDANGACDAFCEVFLEASGYELAYGRTSACPNTANPVWNEQLMYGVDADQVSLVDLKVVLMDWNADGKNRLLGQLRRVPLTELMHSKTMDVWLRALASDDSGKPLTANHGLDLEKCIVHLVLQYEAPQVDAAVGSVLLDPKLTPQTTMPVGEQGAAFISAEQSINRVEAAPANGAGGVGDAGVGMVLKVGEKGQFVVELLAEGSPAALSGKIAPGDIILDVDGQPLAGKTLPEVQQMLRGEQHSPVTLTLLHFIPGAHSYGPQQVVVTVLRSKMSLPPPHLSRTSFPASQPSAVMVLPTGEPMPSIGSYPQAAVSTSNLQTQPAMSPPQVERPLSQSHRERELAHPSPPAIDPTLQRRVEEARTRSEAAARQEVLARSLTAKQVDPFGHLKEEFARLMADIYSDRPDPEMETVYAWKRRLLYGVAYPGSEGGMHSKNSFSSLTSTGNHTGSMTALT